MEAEIKKRKPANENKYGKDDLDIAYKFSAELHKEVGSFIKGIILFGSNARKDSNKNDIDILVILDDVSIFLSDEYIQTYRIIVQKLVGDISKRLHVTTFKYTSFWEFVRNGDPIAINILRDGVPIIDTEFFRPLQLLLYQGRIKPTKEALWTYFFKAPNTLQNSKFHVIQATVDLYWAVIDAAHAALMSLDEIPPSPEYAADMMEEKLVKPGLLEKRYVDILKQFYRLSKMIEHRDIKQIGGAEYDRYYIEAEDFVNRIKKFIEEKK
ncbi:nucleotidyltransferase domain-containing protein [Candidatus Woesearchaeota archaeon]|nr:nucleotidyltransferase domain-containing protein [Candidatus Woesearchaeota archaeon]